MEDEQHTPGHDDDEAPEQEGELTHEDIRAMFPGALIVPMGVINGPGGLMEAAMREAIVHGFGAVADAATRSIGILDHICARTPEDRARLAKQWGINWAVYRKAVIMMSDLVRLGLEACEPDDGDEDRNAYVETLLEMMEAREILAERTKVLIDENGQV